MVAVEVAGTSSAGVAVAMEVSSECRASMVANSSAFYMKMKSNKVVNFALIVEYRKWSDQI